MGGTPTANLNEKRLPVAQLLGRCLQQNYWGHMSPCPGRLHISTVIIIGCIVGHTISLIPWLHVKYNYLGLPVQRRLDGQAYYILLLSFLFLPEPIDEKRPISRPSLLHQQCGPPALLIQYTQTSDPCCPLFTGGQTVPNFGPNFDPSRIQTAVFLNWCALSENKNKLVKDR